MSNTMAWEERLHQQKAPIPMAQRAAPPRALRMPRESPGKKVKGSKMFYSDDTKPVLLLIASEEHFPQRTDYSHFTIVSENLLKDLHF